MNYKFLKYLYASIAFCMVLNVNAASSVDSLLTVLDAEIRNAHKYEAVRLSRIRNLRGIKANLTRPSDIFDVNYQLFNEFLSFCSDSAFYYLDQNYRIAMAEGKADDIRRVMLDQSIVLSRVGLYMESHQILNMISPDSLSYQLLGQYYIANKNLYSEVSDHRPNYNMFAKEYGSKVNEYRNLILGFFPSDSEVYLSESEQIALKSRDYGRAMYYNDMRMLKVSETDPLYALVAYNRFNILTRMGEEEEARKYLVKSAITDVRNATKDLSSMMRLSQVLAQKGDIYRANTFIDYSISSTVYYNTRMRNWSHIIPYSTVTKGFQDVINDQNEKMRIYFVVITLLFLFLAMSLFFIYKQMKKLRNSKNALQVMNQSLTLMKEELQTMNGQLKVINVELSESNHIKEVYIAQLFKLCSNYVDNMRAFQKTAHRLLLKNEYGELMKMTSPTNDLFVSELNRLYKNFDEAFLHIFPNFIKSINSLMAPENAFVLREDERMNPELRVLALIRLGICKSAVIAEFLHYSPTTVYNYRSRLKDKSVCKNEDFEAQVKLIR